MLTELPPLELRIFQLRCGLLDGQVYTLEEVERITGITVERARQIEAQAWARYMTHWPVLLQALLQLWQTGKASQLKTPFLQPLE